MEITVTGGEPLGPKGQDTINQETVLGRLASRVKKLLPRIPTMSASRRSLLLGAAAGVAAGVLGDRLASLPTSPEHKQIETPTLLRPEAIGIEEEPIETYTNNKAFWHARPDGPVRTLSPGPTDQSTAERVNSSIGEVIILKIDPYTILRNPNCYLQIRPADHTAPPGAQNSESLVLSPRQIAAILTEENRDKTEDNRYLTIIITNKPPTEKYDNVLTVPPPISNSNAILNIDFSLPPQTPGISQTAVGYEITTLPTIAGMVGMGIDGMSFWQRETS